MTTPPIAIRHNFKPDEFMWLWAKYVVGFNARCHCTNCLRGRYSHRFSKARNPHLEIDNEIVFDEHNGHLAIYICGVARKGYSSKTNYAHNVHVAIRPSLGTAARFAFEGWTVDVENGELRVIPNQAALPPHLAVLPDRFTTCRIFRWAATESLLQQPQATHGSVAERL